MDDMEEGEFAPPAPTFEFSPELQQAIVASCMRETDFLRRTHGLLRPEYFASLVDAICCQVSLDYYETYKKAPSNTVFVQLIRDRRIAREIPDDIWEDLRPALPGYIGADVSDQDYLVDQVSKFAKHQAMTNALMKSIDLRKKGKFEEIEKIVRSALNVGANDKFEAIDYWEDIESRSRRRKDTAEGKVKPNGITTGIPALDDRLYHRGWGREELSVIMAPAKKGKSTFLKHFAMLANRAGEDVLFISLEVASSIVADRIDATATNMPMNHIVSDWDKVQDELKTQRAGCGKLIIHEYPTNTFSPAALTRLLHHYRYQKGINFGLVVIDYLDLMIPDQVSKESRENSTSIWLNCRRITKEEKIALLTATQTNREGAKVSVAGDTEVADDYNKIRIADIVISINRTDEEERTNKARMYFAASRNQAGKITISVVQDMNRMNPIKSIESIS